MAEVAINFPEPSGEMAPATPLTTHKKFGFIKIPGQIPDPKEWISQQRRQVRSWLLFVQTSNFKAPPHSLPRLSKRIMKNIEYFQANYVFVFIGLVIYCLVTSPLLLFVIAGNFYAGYRLSLRNENEKLKLFGKELTLAQQYGILALCSMPIYYIVGAHAAIFWVIGASMVVITLHAAFYNIDALSGDDTDPLLEV